MEHVTPVAEEAPSPAADHTLFGIIRAAATLPPGPSVQAVVVIDKPTPPLAVVPAVMVQSAKSPPPPLVVVPAVMVQPMKSPPPAAVVPAAPPSGVAPAGYFPSIPKAAAPTEKTTAEKTTAPVEKTVAPAKTPPLAEKTHPVEKTAVRAETPPPPAAVVSAVVPAKAVPTAKAASAEKTTVPVEKTPPAVKAAAPVVMSPPPPAPVPPAAPAKPSAAAQSDTSAAVVAGAIGVLRDSIHPEERARAAEALGACDGWASPNVVQALIEAARSDAEPPVRAACLRSLSRMNVRTLPVATVAQALRTDPDPHVRTEAEQVLKQMGQSSRSQ